MVYATLHHLRPGHDFEVDSTESVWYIYVRADLINAAILKLTPQSQYGILRAAGSDGERLF